MSQNQDTAHVVFASSYWRISRLADCSVLCLYRWNNQTHDLVFRCEFPDFPAALRHIDDNRLHYPVILTSCGLPFLSDGSESQNTACMDLFPDSTDAAADVL